MGVNKVETNDAEIAAELKAVEGEYIAAGDGQAAPAGEGASTGAADPGPASSSSPAMDWTIPAGLVVMIFDRLVAPNWELQVDEKQMLMEQTAATLQVCFPTVNLDPRIAAVLSLGGAFVAVAYKRVDLQTGAIKPMRVAPEEPAGDDNIENRNPS